MAGIRRFGSDKGLSLEERFHKRYKKYTYGCWEWQGYKSPDGYGRLVYEKVNYTASRLSYEYHKGVFDKKLKVCHTCDNPGCVNPTHLFLGTDLDNVNDAFSKNRRRRPQHGKSYTLYNRGCRCLECVKYGVVYDKKRRPSVRSAIKS